MLIRPNNVLFLLDTHPGIWPSDPQGDESAHAGHHLVIFIVPGAKYLLCLLGKQERFAVKLIM